MLYELGLAARESLPELVMEVCEWVSAADRHKATRDAVRMEPGPALTDGAGWVHRLTGLLGSSPAFSLGM